MRNWLFLALCLVPGSLAAATTPEAEVRAVVQQFFAAMEQGDAARLEATLHPQVRFLSAGHREGRPVLLHGDPQAFLKAVGGTRGESWEERIGNLEIRIDDALATAWMDYTFHVDGKFSHCGVNAFQLFRSAQGWKIIQITDTRRQNGCRLAGED